MRTNNSKPIAQQLTGQIPNLLTGSEIDYEITGDIEIDPSIRFEVIRAIREIVINSRRHSGCNQIKIHLAKNEIKIVDNGSGGVSEKNNSYGSKKYREISASSYEVMTEKPRTTTSATPSITWAIYPTEFGIKQKNTLTLHKPMLLMPVSSSSSN